MNTPWIEIKEMPSGKYILRIQMGTSGKIVKNISREDARSIARRHIISEVRKYVNHRSRIIRKHGGRCNESTLKSITRLQYAFKGSTLRWKLEDLPKIVGNWSNDLINIAPGTSSKFYKKQSQFLIDLISWAKYQKTSV